MARFYVDCRDFPSEMNCTVAISADTKPELVDAAVQHAVAVHGHHDSPQLREQLAKDDQVAIVRDTCRLNVSGKLRRILQETHTTLALIHGHSPAYRGFDLIALMRRNTPTTSFNCILWQ